MQFNDRTRKQLAEALGPDNKWFCSQKSGHEVTDPETLVKHYIKNGGAEDFARRFESPPSSEDGRHGG